MAKANDVLLIWALLNLHFYAKMSKIVPLVRSRDFKIVDGFWWWHKYCCLCGKKPLDKVVGNEDE